MGAIGKGDKLKRIYLDYAATTPVDQRVLDVMLPYFIDGFGNPSGVYFESHQSAKALEKARGQVAQAVGANAKEIYFTSGGTEADNWAIKGIADALVDKGRHIITSSIEHHGILNPCEFLEERGYEITYLPVDSFGMVSLEAVKSAVREDTILVSIMMANNEVGTIAPIAEIGAFLKSQEILFHTDGVQALGNIPIDVNALNVDLMSLSGHKIYGPKGIGALYIKNGVAITNMMHGGHQEREKRAGTENVPAIVGFGEASERITLDFETNVEKMLILQKRLIDGVLENISGAYLNGHPTLRLPGNCHFSFDGVDGEALLTSLDMAGISASGGSACTSGALEPSHVLMAMGRSKEAARGVLRLTLGHKTTLEDVEMVIEKLIEIIERLRRFSEMV